MSVVAVVQLQNDMAAQRRATEFALRKRTHSEEQSRHELEWQLKIVSDNFSSFALSASEVFSPKIASYLAQTGW